VVATAVTVTVTICREEMLLKSKIITMKGILIAIAAQRVALVGWTTE
jgi:hypothetical protein